MLILSLFVLQALSGSFCYDLELEGNVRIGNNYINALRQPPELVNLVLKYLSSHFEGKGKLPDLAPIMPIMVMRANAKTSTETIKNNNMDPLKQLVTHLQKKGKVTLNKLGTKIITDLNITKDITPILNIITNDYEVMMENYYDFVKKSQNESERDLIYLDMAERSCELLRNEEKKLLNDIIMHENQNTQTALQHGSFQNMTEKILELSHKDKKEAFKYICNTYEICRQYPAFTDYCAKLISEVLILEDYKFLAVLNTLTKILKQNENMLAKISEKEDRELIMEKLRDLSNDLFAAKKILILARSVLKKRYLKTVSKGGEEFQMRSKAIRIILDILDKALSTEDDILAIDFDNTMHVIRHWSIQQRNEVDKNLEDFAKSLLRKLQYNLTKDARIEIKVLIKTLMRGNTKDDEVYQRLFKSGSKYMKGELYSDLEIMNI